MAEGRTFSDLFTIKKSVEGEGYGNKYKSKSPNSAILSTEERKKNVDQVNSFIERNYEKEKKKKADKDKTALERKEADDRLARENATP